ncbi:hypothetical protein [Streptomyces sp. NPDC058280]|uniref:hypothetical protein n=1 Tax=Streptomyces sp. NPDC058280 TaxID=3346419 RepID=UPI0036EAE584
MSDKGAALFTVDDLPTLKLNDIIDESEAELQARGAAYAREYAEIEQRPVILARNMAMVCIALRLKLQDMVGSSYEYKQTVAEFYRMSGVTGDRLERMQGTVRWHVGNTLRRHMTPRELERHGLLATSPLERQQDSRAVNAAIVQSIRASEAVRASTPRKAPKTATGEPSQEPEQTGSPVKATADHLRLAHVAGSIVGQLDTDVIDTHMTPGQRAKLDEELAALQKAIAALRRHTRKPSSSR